MQIQKTLQDKLVPLENQVNNAMVQLAQLVSQLSSLEAVAPVFSQIVVWQKALEANHQAIRDATLSMLQKQGQKTDGNGYELEVDGWKLTAYPQNNGYDHKKVEKMLRARGLQPMAFMDEHVTYKTNPGKLDHAVSVNILTREEVDACRADKDYRVSTPKKVS